MSYHCWDYLAIISILNMQVYLPYTELKNSSVLQTINFWEKIG